MQKKNGAARISAEELGFRVWSGQASPMSGLHTHSEIEINFVTRGAMHYFLSGRFCRIETGRLAMFWAGAPHQLLEAEEDAELIWLTLPLPWFLQWNLSGDFTSRLLSGELIVQPDGFEYSHSDADLMQRWANDKSNEESRRIVLLELEARLRRLAQALENVPTEKATSKHLRQGSATTQQIERLAAHLSSHYHEEVSLDAVAREVGLHPHYAMQIFKDGCGLTLGNYLLRLRLSHAQRLLLTTDWSIGRIAEESGFGSPGRFHAVFKKHCAQTPRVFRLRHEESSQN
jgi:AraC-like DNA-binding protein